MTSYTEKFQQLLRELFQFDCADLDFGIYRIMNYKRDVIEKFITQDLPKAIAEELDRGALADQSQAAKELIEVAQKIKETLGKDALDADGNLAEAYHGTPLGKKYQDLKAKAASGRGQALEASIFNHLYAFFNRYYQDGDFISKRRYSKRQRYAIPTTARKSTCTRPTTISTMSRPPSTSMTTPSRRGASRRTSSSRPQASSRTTSRETSGFYYPAPRRSPGMRRPTRLSSPLSTGR